VSPSVYLVRASVDLTAIKRGQGVLGSAVAISKNMALTNCHVVANHQTIVLYADKPEALFMAKVAFARCIVEVDGNLKPIAAVRSAG
jgi:hypothetical protein